MKKEFPGYFANSGSDIESLWAKCLFVLDANVLLDLYRYSDSTRDELLTVFDFLADRVWVPHQVVHEYLVNRLETIGHQEKIYDDTAKRVKDLKGLLEAQNQPPFISESLLVDCVVMLDKLNGELSDNKKIHESRISTDEIKDRLQLLLDGKVGAPYSSEKLEEILVSGKIRYDEKIPPGYKDAKKGGDSIVFLDRCRPYGDLIVWLQIMDKSRETGSPVIFVTGDTKEDWWTKFQGKTIGPHPQLVAEFLSSTGNAFYMYPPDRFLERAGVYLEKQTTEKSLREIRDVRDEDAALLDEAINSYWPASIETRGNRSMARAFRNGLVAGMRGAPIEDNQPDLLDLPWNRDRLIEITAALEINHALILDTNNEMKSVLNRLTVAQSHLTALMSQDDGVSVGEIELMQAGIAASQRNLISIEKDFNELRHERMRLREEQAGLRKP